MKNHMLRLIKDYIRCGVVCRNVICNMNERLAIFDILKGIGILLVIVGHTFMKEIGPYILAFHMPLFFIVAGYFF